MGGRRGRLVSTEMGGESTVMEAGRSFVGALAEPGRFAARAAVFVEAFGEASAGAAVFVGALKTLLIALGGLIIVATPLSLGGIITENSST